MERTEEIADFGFVSLKGSCCCFSASAIGFHCDHMDRISGLSLLSDLPLVLVEQTERVADESCGVGGANLTLRGLFCFTIISPYATNEITAASDVT